MHTTNCSIQLGATSIVLHKFNIYPHLGVATAAICFAKKSTVVAFSNHFDFTNAILIDCYAPLSIGHGLKIQTNAIAPL